MVTSAPPYVTEGLDRLSSGAVRVLTGCLPPIAIHPAVTSRISKTLADIFSLPISSSASDCLA